MIVVRHRGEGGTRSLSSAAFDKSGEKIVGSMAMGVISFYGEEECMEWQRLHCTFTGSIVARCEIERKQVAAKPWY
jgi:hypothetical protein